MAQKAVDLLRQYFVNAMRDESFFERAVLVLHANSGNIENPPDEPIFKEFVLRKTPQGSVVFEGFFQIHERRVHLKSLASKLGVIFESAGQSGEWEELAETSDREWPEKARARVRTFTGRVILCQDSYKSIESGSDRVVFGTKCASCRVQSHGRQYDVFFECETERLIAVQHIDCHSNESEVVETHYYTNCPT